MARKRERVVMTARNTWILTKAAASSWVDDYAQSMGAALAYYTMLSIAPFLLIVISLAGMIFGVDAARGEIAAQLQGLMGREGAEAVQKLLESASKPAESITAAVAGLVLLLVGATSVFAELQDALDRIWRAPKRSRRGILSLLRARLLSFGTIAGISFLMMVSLVVSAALAALGKLWGPRFSDWQTLVAVVNVVFSYVLTTTVFAMIYKVMPRVKVAWRDVLIGATVTALLFTIGKSLIGLYIGRSGLTSGFGAAGSLVMAMVWVYYSAQIFLLGAEFTWAYALTFGSRKEKKLPGAAPAVPSKAADKKPDASMLEAKEAAVVATESAAAEDAGGPGT
ncbi:MAG TPA: YihY/virulence factor BrkB family protein [Thermoanaerobaculia bacterium]|jgi:membrane protein|nr:YihY/virulence factor BrkB family protein [Thermoanaerobaculia bacterium]